VSQKVSMNDGIDVHVQVRSYCFSVAKALLMIWLRWTPSKAHETSMSTTHQGTGYEGETRMTPKALLSATSSSDHHTKSPPKLGFPHAMNCPPPFDIQGCLSGLPYLSLFCAPPLLLHRTIGLFPCRPASLAICGAGYPPLFSLNMNTTGNGTPDN